MSAAAWCAASVAMVVLCASAMAEPIALSEAAPATRPADVVAPWVELGEAGWAQGEPAFRILDGDAALADGWIGVSRQSILLRLIVRDSAHENHSTGYEIYNGDGVQVGIDARGDGAGRLPPDTRLCGPDDAAMGFALTDSGPQAWAWHLRRNYNYGAGNREGGMPELAPKIIRDEQAGTTSYDIAIPWEILGTPAGLRSEFGIAVQVNQGSGQARRELSWGQGAGGLPQPGLFPRVRIGPPNEDVVAIAATKEEIWYAGDAAEADISLMAEGAFTVRATCGTQMREIALAAGLANRHHRRYVLRIDPEPAAQQASIQVLTGGRVVASTSLELRRADGDVEALMTRLAELGAKADDPLVRDSLAAVVRVARWQWRRSLDALAESDLGVQDTLRWMVDLRAMLADDMSRMSSYTAGRYQLYYAKPTAEAGDDWMNLYAVRLPRGWQSGRAYPVVFSLHGAGQQHPLQHVAADVAPAEIERYSGEPGWTGAYYQVKPFVGRNGYRHKGETYTWEQIDDFLSRFAVEPDRRVLSGGSMGGFGTWALGLRAPDRFSALLIDMGGGDDSDYAIGLGRNASGLPIYIAHGGADTLVPVEHAYRMRDELKRWGYEPVVQIFQDYGHDLPRDYHPAAAERALKHVRTRPARFAYVSDSDRYRGAWGITMQRPAAAATAASDVPATQPGPPVTCSFQCTVDGSTVAIDTQDTPRIDVELGSGGLGLEGEVHVTLNGRPAYRGPATRISLDVN